MIAAIPGLIASISAFLLSRNAKARDAWLESEIVPVAQRKAV